MNIPSFPFRDLATKTAVALGVSVGVLGFVTVVGAVGEVLRLNGAGIPSYQVVGALPKSQLLVFGAVSLAPLVVALALVVGIVATVRVVFVIASRRSSRPVSAGKPGGPHPVVSKITPHVADRLRRTLEAFLVLIFLGVWVLTRHQRVHPLGVAGTLVFVALLAAGTGYLVNNERDFWKLVAVGIGLLLIFGVATSVANNLNAPGIYPAAMVVDGRPQAGIYAGASGTDVFLGHVCTSAHSKAGDRSTGSTEVIPRSHVSTILIGHRTELPFAIAEERSLLHELVSLAKITPSESEAAAPVSPRPTVEVVCTDASAAALAVAVGTGLRRYGFGPPPAQIPACALTHWAPALGSGVESPLGPGMQDSGLR